MINSPLWKTRSALILQAAFNSWMPPTPSLATSRNPAGEEKLGESAQAGAVYEIKTNKEQRAGSWRLLHTPARPTPTPLGQELKPRALPSTEHRSTPLPHLLIHTGKMIPVDRLYALIGWNLIAVAAES